MITRGGINQGFVIKTLKLFISVLPEFVSILLYDHFLKKVRVGLKISEGLFFLPTLSLPHCLLFYSIHSIHDYL